MPTIQQARHWLDRWDRQQEFYIADREERFAVIADVVESVTGRPDPLIVDLGAGPGSLSIRLLDRLPNASVVAVDADPLLLGLARTAFGDRPGLRIVDRDLRQPGWTEALDLPRRPDAIVSTTALHWLTRPQLAALYRACGELLVPGGVFVNGDNLAEASTRAGLDELTRQITRARALRVGVLDNEDWRGWWEAVAEAPELADLRAEFEPHPLDHSVPEVPTVDDHLELLRAARFAEVGTVWQHGDDRVLVALR